MTRADYDRYRDKELRGRKAVLLRDVANRGGLRMKEGTVVTIRPKFGGIDIEGELCSHCGVQVYIKGVDYQSVDLLPRNAGSAPAGRADGGGE